MSRSQTLSLGEPLNRSARSQSVPLDDTTFQNQIPLEEPVWKNEQGSTKIPNSFGRFQTRLEERQRSDRTEVVYKFTVPGSPPPGSRFLVPPPPGSPEGGSQVPVSENHIEAQEDRAGCLGNKVGSFGVSGGRPSVYQLQWLD